MTESKRHTVSEVIDSLGINKFTWVTFFFLGFAMIFDGYDFMIVNVTNVDIATAFNLMENGKPGALMGSLSTWSLIGMIIGGAVGGMLSDKYGRKKILCLAIAFYSLFTFPQAFAQDYFVFAAFRLIAGLGIGSCIPVVVTCFSELMPSSNRATFTTVGLAFMVGGWVIAGFLGGAIANHPQQLMPGFTEIMSDGRPANWRLAFLIGGAPFLYSILLGFLMKETPYWYANKGHSDLAAVRLNEIASLSGRQSNLTGSDLVLPPKMVVKSRPTELFSRRYILTTCAIWSVAFIGNFAIYGMNAWLKPWFLGIGYSPDLATLLLTFNNVAAIVSNSVVGLVSDKVGRRRNLSFAWLLAIAAVVVCSLFVAPDNFALCFALVMFFGFAMNYANCAIHPIMPEGYPTQIRNTGVAWCQAFGRLGGAVAPIILGSLATNAFFQWVDPATGIEGTHWNMVFLVLIVPLALGFVCTRLLFKRETAGKSLDEIQEEIRTIPQGAHD